MDVSLTLVHGYESKPYSGPLRPFINWAEKFSKDYQEIDLNLILFKSNPKIIENFSPKLKKKTILINNHNELSKAIKDFGPDIIMSDDYIPRLKLLEKISRDYTKAKTIIYIQFLYGVHSISNCFYYDQIPFKEKFMYRMSSLIPYKLLSLRYVKMLKNNNIFISNSEISKSLFFWLYKIHVEEVIYPPVNTDIFKPDNNKINNDFDNVLVYLGSSGGDVNLRFLYRIIETIIQRGFKVHLFGNEKVGKIIKRSFNRNIEYYKNLSDIELAELYSKSLVTICPQTWELFGYTAVESMACGTPVIAFNYFGHSETIIDRKTGLLANSYDEFIKKLKLILDKSIKFDRNMIRKHVIEHFSTDSSAKKLVNHILSLNWRYKNE